MSAVVPCCGCFVIIPSPTPPRPHPVHPPAQGPRDRLPRTELRLVTRPGERYAQVQQLRAEGASRAGIGRRLGRDVETVRRFADATDVEDLLANTRRDTL